MRQDKAVARILLIFSVADVALAAPAVVRQRVAVIPASKKRTESTDSDSDWSRVSPSPSFHESHHLHPFVYNFICRLGAPCPASFHGSEPWDSPPDSPPHDSTPASPAESEAPLHDDPTPVATDDPTPVATTTSAHGDLAPEAKSIFSDELKRRIKILSAVAAVYTVSASVIYGGILKAKDKHSSRAYVSPFFALSPVDI